MRERRAFARIEVDLPASMFLYQLDVFHTGAIADLSRGGCFVPTDHEVPAGEKCQLTLTTGTGLETTSIGIEGRIVRSTPEGVGIQFENLSPSARTVLEDLLESAAATTSS